MAKLAFNLRPTEDTVVFIDGPNIYGAAKIVNCDIDYRLLRSYFADNSYTNRVFYYSSILDTGDQDEHVTIRPLLDWLSYNGFHVFTKSQREFTDSTGKRKIKGSMIVDMASDIIKAAALGTKHIVLFSGDGEFTSVLRTVQELGARTTVVSTKQSYSGSPMVSDELLRQTDNFVDLRDVVDVIARPREDRAPQRELLVSEPRSSPTRQQRA